MRSVLVVDDNDSLRSVVRSWVDDLGFRAREAAGADEALAALTREGADITLCEVSDPAHSGVRLAAEIRERFPATAIVLATAARDIETAVASLRNDVVDYLLKPFNRDQLLEALVLARDWNAALTGVDELHHALHDRLRARHARVAATLSEAQASTAQALDGLISMLQLHERDGRGHATRVARLALAIADEMSLAEDLFEQIEHGALLHDIGKLNMPTFILTKPSPLTNREWRLMRTHPQAGYDILSSQARFAPAAEVVVAHHEAYDGSGYPRGLEQRDIPIAARILSVADAYDSMTHPHTQRPAMTPLLAIEEIERCSGSQFDPDCAAALGPVLQHAVEEAFTQSHPVGH